MTISIQELKDQAELLNSSNPQRGALLGRAASKLDEGFQLLLQLGFQISSLVHTVEDVWNATQGIVPAQVEPGNPAGAPERNPALPPGLADLPSTHIPPSSSADPTTGVSAAQPGGPTNEFSPVVPHAVVPEPVFQPEVPPKAESVTRRLEPEEAPASAPADPLPL